MRLTIINQFYLPDISPTAALSASLAEHRARQGDIVTIVASRGGYVPASGDADHSIDTNPRVYRLWTPRLGKSTIIKRCVDYAFFYWLALWRAIRLPRQDIIICLTTPPYIAWVGVLHKLLHPRTRLVLWNMDCYPDAAERVGVIKPGGLLARLMRAMNRSLFRRIHHLVCLDTAMADLLTGQYAPHGRELPVSVIPNWEPAAFFPPTALDEPWPEAAALGLAGRFVVVYMGNMGTGHHFESMLDAAEALKDDLVSFLLVGGGSRRASVDAEIARRRLSNIILRGYLPTKEETRQVMAAASCALITLRDAALGVMSPSKLHANLAMSLPVIYLGPAGSNVDDAIRRFGCGVTLASDDSAGLVNFIRRMMAHPAELQDLRRRARRAFDEAYSDTGTLVQFDQVLTDVLPQSHPSAPETPATSAATPR